MFHHMACRLVRQARVYYGKGLCHVRSTKLKLDGLGHQFGRFTHTARTSVTLGGTMQNVTVGGTMLHSVSLARDKRLQACLVEHLVE